MTPRMLHIQDHAELLPDAAWFLVQCVPGAQGLSVVHVAGWKRAFEVGSDNWDVWREHLLHEADSEGVTTIFVQGELGASQA